jgi:hypothetical protein
MNNLFAMGSFCLNILILIISGVCFCKIMKNDLTHLQNDVTELKKSIEHIFKKVNSLCQRTSRIEGKLEGK